MSSKQYQYKVIEATDPGELESRLHDAGSERWAAVGYGLLPDGRRSVLLSRKVKGESHEHHKHGRHGHRTSEAAVADSARTTE